MAESFDRRRFPAGPYIEPSQTSTQRGPKRIGRIGAIVPGDDVEVARELARQHHHRKQRFDPGVWPMQYSLFQPGPWDWGYERSGATAWTGAAARPTADANAWHGWYSECTNNGATICFFPYLGPQGSVWAIDFAADHGPDCGIVEFSLATVSPDWMDDWDWALGGKNLIAGPYEDEDRLTDASFFAVQDSADPRQDLYNAGHAASPATLHVGFSHFRILGEPGDPLTSRGVYNGGGGWCDMDGGPGLYCLRVKIEGKNASSSGYRVRFEDLNLRRWIGPGFPTV